MNWPWQPVDENTPRDRDLLLACPARGVLRGRWEDDKYATKPRPYWTNDRERIYGIRATRDDQPTHWMDLPPNPAKP